MCGIFGHIGKRDSIKLCISGLKNLEYRGYDSAGIAGIQNGQLLSRKEIGKIAALEKALEEHPLDLNLAIAHTRWATHGTPTKENAHPHFDEKNSVAVVHNGIIENHHELREMLKKQGKVFSTDTDTEVVAQLVSHFYVGDLIGALREAIALMKGTWGIALIHKDHPEHIAAASKENPLAVALDTQGQEAFISSDAGSFQGNQLEVTFLQKGDIALISNRQIDCYDLSGEKVVRKPEIFSSQNSSISKNGYEHFMLKEIFEQPHTLQQAIHQRCDLEQGQAVLPQIASQIQDVDRIHIIACGTSWHAGMLASLFFENFARIPSQAEIASEYRHKNPIITPNTLAIAISQSGETLDTLAALRCAKEQGAKTIALCNMPHSTLAREADSLLLLNAGPEISVCSTKAFTSQVSVLQLIALQLGRQSGHISKEKGKLFLDALIDMPHVIKTILGQHEEIRRIAKKYAPYSHCFFLGRHYMYITALEAALKLKEISYLNATAYPAGELKHGPFALLDTQFPVIALLGNVASYDKMLSSLMEVKARKSPVLVFAPEGDPQATEELLLIADDVIWLPALTDEQAPIAYSVACQLLAYYIAKERGTEIDQPRNLAKSVTVE